MIHRKVTYDHRPECDCFLALALSILCTLTKYVPRYYEHGISLFFITILQIMSTLCNLTKKTVSSKDDFLQLLHISL